MEWADASVAIRNQHMRRIRELAFITSTNAPDHLGDTGRDAFKGFSNLVFQTPSCR
jgi:hypothetical protein